MSAHSIIRTTASQHSIIRSFDHSIIHKASGFTLIELLVVIGIIGVLAGVLLASFGGSTESAASARCLSNLKNLATACQTYGMNTGHYPPAASIESLTMSVARGRKNVSRVYHETPGWISWYSNGGYPSESTRENPEVPMCTKDILQGTYALTNGALWKYVSGSRETYVCPAHAKKSANPPYWSYLMNAYFGWNPKGKNTIRIEYGNLARADRILLFSEVPFTGPGDWFPNGSGSGEDSDAILQFKPDKNVKGGAGLGANKSGGEGSECIGFNHRVGKRFAAHVVFADGHTEKLLAPVDGGGIVDLTTWLCQGVDVSFDGEKYDLMDKADK